MGDAGMLAALLRRLQAAVVEKRRRRFLGLGRVHVSDSAKNVAKTP
jgi:hypothetical protein